MTSQPTVNKLIFIFVLLFFATALHAEEGCPPGQYPQQGQGWQTCVPIPGYPTAQPTRQQAPQWESRWGALAVNAEGQIEGAAKDKLTESEAVAAAVADCEAYGQKGCKKFETYRNGCIAVVAGNLKSTINSASNEPDAVTLATSDCVSSGQTECHVYYSACSLSRRIQ